MINGGLTIAPHFFLYNKTTTIYIGLYIFFFYYYGYFIEK